MGIHRSWVATEYARNWVTKLLKIYSLSIENVCQLLPIWSAIGLTIAIYLGMDQDYFSIFADYAKSVEACSNHIQNLKENNLFGITHDGFSENMYYVLLGSDCRIFFMIRDPRDVLISYIDWIDTGRVPNVVDPISLVARVLIEYIT